MVYCADSYIILLFIAYIMTEHNGIKVILLLNYTNLEPVAPLKHF